MSLFIEYELNVRLSRHLHHSISVCHLITQSHKISMVRKRLSKEYMELLMRYQKSLNVIQEDCSVSGSVHSLEEGPSENEINPERTNEVVSGVTPENEEINIKQEVKSVGENIFEDDIIDRVIENNILNLSDKSEETNIDRKPKPRPRRRICRNPFENFKPRRSAFVERANSLHYERLMKLVGQERLRHREMINSVNNTTFALSRRPLSSHNNHSSISQRRKKVKSPPPLPKVTKKSNKRVRFGTLVTFEDGGSPVPIRPTRRKPPRSGKLTTSAQKMEDLPRQDFLPEKPRRVYAGRAMTGSTLSEALQTQQPAEQSESAVDRIKRLVKTVENTGQEERNNSKNRTLLSALNLFLSLAYESQFDVSWLRTIDPHSSGRNPTALEQLRGKQRGSVYLRNIPTLLLFNLIFGGSL